MTTPRNKKNKTRIYIWRKAMGIRSQEELAHLLQVSQGTVSAWEDGKENRAPSKEMYFRMGLLSTRAEDIKWFFARAGIDPSAILQVADVIRAGRSGARGGSEKAVYLPPLEPTPGLRKIPWPPGRLPRPDHTSYVALPVGSGSEIFWPGDTILVDTFHRGERKLRPYWDQLVMASFPVRPFEPGDPVVQELRLEGLQVGWIALERSQVFDEGARIRFQASFEPLSGSRAELIGMWLSPRAPAAAGRGNAISYAGLEESASQEMEIAGGVVIHGQIVGWALDSKARERRQRR